MGEAAVADIRRPGQELTDLFLIGIAKSDTFAAGPAESVAGSAGGTEVPLCTLTVKSNGTVIKASATAAALFGGAVFAHFFGNGSAVLASQFCDTFKAGAFV